MKDSPIRSGARTLILCVVLVASCARHAPAQADASPQTAAGTGGSYEDWGSRSQTAIELRGASAAVSGPGAAVNGSTVTISEGGVYVVSGTLDDGQIVVEAGKKDTVQLVLKSARITDRDSAPIYVKNAGEVVITLPEGSASAVKDVRPRASGEISDGVPNAAIYSEDDLVFSGTGSLTIEAGFDNGITGKDDLLVTGGTIKIAAVDDGLVGRDTVTVTAGALTIAAGGDGIRSTNDADAGKGLILIEGGTLDIKAGADGVQAVTSVSVAMGIGSLSIEAGDDGVNSSGTIRIAGGRLSIACGDDAIHADVSLAIEGGSTSISKSYEGIESAAITISGGVIRLVSSDDGINVVGAGGETFMGRRPGTGAANIPATQKLTITGGEIAVDAMGDGVDINGSILMSGGTLVVSGPTSSGNGAIDYDGVFEMTGGLLVAAGSAGMAQAPSQQSTQCSVSMTFSRMQQAGTLFHLRDTKGNTVATFAPARSYQSVVVSSPAIVKGATYSLYTGGTSTGGEYRNGRKVIDFTVSGSVTWLTESGVTTQRGGFGGGPAQRGR